MLLHVMTKVQLCDAEKFNIFKANSSKYDNFTCNTYQLLYISILLIMHCKKIILVTIISNDTALCISYIPVQVSYLSYYPGPRRSRGRG